MPTLRIALVDDHPLTREGMRELLDFQPDMKVVAEAGDARSAIRLSTSVEADVFVIDLGLPDQSGLSVTRELRHACHGAHILVLTMHDRAAIAARAFVEGATGYALKDQPVEELAEAVATVGRGERYLAPRLRDAGIDALLARGGSDLLSRLSRRERDVFELHIRGLTNEQAAKQLFVSAKTVDSHRTRIFRKLGVHSITELIRLAAEAGAVLER